MTRPARLRIVGLVLLLPAVAICILLVITLKPGPGPISLNVSQNQSDSQMAVVELTNHTRYYCNVYAFWTEVLSNGVWVDALAQHSEARIAHVLFPHAHRTLEVPVPGEG